jgi:hypothetical protein
MRRPIGRQQPGERYLLQFPGGVERLAEVILGSDPADGPRYQPLDRNEPLPPRQLPGGEWLLEPGERLIRDWSGTFWSVATTGSSRAPGDYPAACRIQFTRHSPSGERFTYRAPSLWHPAELGDEDLVAMLRRAWETLDTDAEERLRRSIPVPVEL